MPSKQRDFAPNGLELRASGRGPGGCEGGPPPWRSSGTQQTESRSADTEGSRLDASVVLLGVSSGDNFRGPRLTPNSRVSGGIKGNQFRRVKQGPGTAPPVPGHTAAPAASVGRPKAEFIPRQSGLAHRPPSRAVNRNRSRRSARVFVIRLDGFDHEIEFVGAVDLSGNAVVLA